MSEQSNLDRIRNRPEGAADIGNLIRRGLFLALGALILYLFAPQLLDIISEAERLRTIRPGWFVVMIGFELASFACIWWIMRLLLPGLSWFVAATSQIVSNALSRVIPGGAATGGAAMFRMLSVGGVNPGQAGGALAAMSIISTAILFSIPAMGLVLALLGAPVPENMWPVAVAGGVMFVSLLLIGAVAVTTDRPLRMTGAAISSVLEQSGARFGTKVRMGPDQLLTERDRLVEVVGGSWKQVFFAAASNWLFDYMALVAALYGVGAKPRLSLVLLAYAFAALAGMIPLTPGGLGFVEATLTSLLVISGISLQNALLAVAAYRLVSLLLPILASLPAWAAYRWKLHPSKAPGVTDSEPVRQT